MEGVKEEIRPGYKLTKLGWIPEDWDFDKSGNAIRYFGGAAFKSKDQTEAGVRWLKIANIGINSAKWNKESFLPDEFIDDHKRYLLGSGDIVMALTRPILDDKLKITMLTEDDCPALLNQRVAKLMAKNGHVIEFIYHLFQTPYFVHSMNVCMAGTDPPNIGNVDLESIKIPLPSYSEQKAIAQVLSTWDKAIENLTQLIFEKQHKKKALMQALLIGKKRFSGFDREWKEVKLGEYFMERKESKRPDLPLLSIGSTGVYPQAESNKKDTSNADKAKYKRICPDDIGYNTMRMWQGRSALSSLEGIVSPAYTIVTPKENADVLFFSYLFKFPYVVHRFFRNSQGLVNDTLNCKFKDFAIVKVLVPSTKEEQTKIAQVLKNADAEIKVLEKKKDHLQDQKKGLMQQLLTGKKRLNTKQ